MLGPEDGALAIGLARHALAAALGRPTPAAGDLPPRFAERRGAFVSWYREPGHLLRGCVGYPLPVLPMAEAIRRAAVAAGRDDPRFPPIQLADLTALVAEVSVLTNPIPLRPEQLPSAVVVGRDGLLLDAPAAHGLLLPQVAVEQRWSAAQFLDGTCEKAGAARGAWRDPTVRIARFEAEVFAERAPGGAVVRRSLGPA